MKLSAISEAMVGDVVIGYHATSSFHQVCDIFENGFLDLKGLGHLCLSLTKRQVKQWADALGGAPYVIRFVADRSQVLPGPRSEFNIAHDSAKPVQWGIITGEWAIPADMSKLGIKWLGDDPTSFDYSQLDRSGLDPFVQKLVKHDFERGHLSRQDQVALAVLGKTYSYQYIEDLDPRVVSHVKRLIKSTDHILHALQQSGVSIKDFHTIFVDMLGNEVDYSDFVEFRHD